MDDMLKSIKYLLIFMSTVSLWLSSCATPVNSTQGNTIVVTPAIQGNSASLRVGDTLEIQIPTIPTEGFDWVVQDLDPNILIQEGTAEYTADTTENSAGGIVTVSFKAVNPGQTTLTLIYLNAALGVSSSSFGITVTVK
jgi:predicted secreted protein